ncbi:MAG: T9SS type A sorting domain-containing protein [Bacteroidota bacterium]
MKHTKYGLLLTAFFFSNFLFAQYRTQLNPPLPRSGTVNLAQLQDDFFPVLQGVAAPTPSGSSYRSFLERQKQQVNKLFPRKETAAANYREEAEPPMVLREFNGNSASGGVPLDNHIAISNDGWIVSVINTNMSIYDKAGTRYVSRSLNKFSESIETKSNFKFDPRVIYDPAADRFIITFISGFECENSEIVFAFSESNNPNGDWHLYVIDGCPFDDNTFADYPMFALTEKELFFTINAVRENVSWQEGFEETLIYQIDKESGYSGGELKSRMWSEVEYEGRNIRNVCPIRAADALVGPDCYLLSNRNFDVRNDTFFVLRVTDVLDAPDVALEVEAVRSDIRYGLAPNAIQKFGTLQTNDSRVLDGFLLDDQIQFVMNCVDSTRGSSAIFHGVLDGLFTDKTITGQVLSNGEDDFGYPGIAWSGLDVATDRDAIIVLSHSARLRNVGWSAIYYDNEGRYSPITSVKEGDSFIDRLDENLERWGDYVGIQRRYDAPGRIWAASTFGNFSKNYATWIAELGRPGLDLTSLASIPEQSSMQLFPNPANEVVTVSFELPAARRFQLYLLDATGRRLQQFYNELPKKSGAQQFSFSTSPLEGGIYFLQVVVDDRLQFAKRLVVQR